MSTLEERQMRKRAVELGNSGDIGAVSELISIAQSSSFHASRLAISGLGKLAKIADSQVVIPVLLNGLRSPHSQVRQYSMKSLAAYGFKAQAALPDLYDISNNCSEPDYNQKQSKTSIDIIEKSVEIYEKSLHRHCQKCGKEIVADEYARSQKAFQRSYCDNCFDEVYLQRRNWNSRVELNKNIKTKDGTLVQSKGEKKIAEWLAGNNISYRYDERFRIIEGYAVRPDFYLPEFDVYIEYWGMDTIDYKIGMLKKKKVYQMTGKRLISLYPDDCLNLDFIMREKLSRYISF
jgi:hypothetical protein